MSHGFDDQGRQFDAKGNLRDWWTPEDAAKYKAAAQKMIDQFNGYTVVDSATHVNGQRRSARTSAILADSPWRTTRWRRRSQAGRSSGKIDGFTPEQRFFLGWAQSLARGAAAGGRAAAGEHGPALAGQMARERAAEHDAGVCQGVRVQGRRSDGAAEHLRARIW